MPGIEIRKLLPHEIHSAVKLVVPSATRLEQEQDKRAEHFLTYLDLQSLDIDWRMAVVRGSKLVGACLGIKSPGRTAMILSSSSSPEDPGSRGLIMALTKIEHYARQSGVVLLQSLVPSTSRDQARVLSSAEYQYLAELRYLTLGLEGREGPTARCERIVLADYPSVSTEVFSRTLERTYEGSLDCPALAGLRDTSDIILGHRHTGIHDPRLWLLATVDAEPIGVVLLTYVPLRSALEIIYVGVVPEARGNAYGKHLVATAIDLARQAHKDHLVLAVDHRNHYALHVYKSLGFAETDSRHAWIRSLVP